MNPDRKKTMLTAFLKFSARIATEYEKVYAMLEQGNYEGANAALASLARTHAATSLSLRNLCIKEGVITE